VLSLVLIVYGGMIVFSGFASGPTLAPQMSEIYSRMGLGTYTATALAGSLGRIVNFVSAILFVITLIVTGTLLRRGHIAFYVPLIAGIISTIFAAACLVALLAQDPGALSRIGG
jgi:preprotein translocase subunit SecF